MPKLDEQRPIFLVASGDLRLGANQLCWPAQKAMESAIEQATSSFGRTVRRAHAFDEKKGHGFLDSQRLGMDVFTTIPENAPLIVAEAVWQYSHHVLPGLTTHRGPILTLANWSGQWPGLVGLLNLNASLTKAGVVYSSLWSADFKDSFFLNNLKLWLETGAVLHSINHVHPFHVSPRYARSAEKGREIAKDLRQRKAILGVFDEGCMGMFNAIVPDHLFHPMGLFKERLSQSALYAEVLETSDDEAVAQYRWLIERGMHFNLGTDPANELTLDQVLLQCKMYISALRIADDFGCAAIGMQYQQGLKDLLPASDLAEGLLNNVDRPPVKDRSGTRILYEGCALPHFNEVDECAAVDALVTNRVWTALGLSPETTLHDLRYGEEYESEFVWVFEISGAAPPAHFIGGYMGASSERQPAMYFRLGGGSLKGISKPGEIVWSRVYIEDDKLKADLGRGKAIALPEHETDRRWKMTTSQWPIMHAVLYGVTRDQMMGRHKSNHIQVAYASSADAAAEALTAKAACFQEMGLDVFFCGEMA